MCPILAQFWEKKICKIKSISILVQIQHLLLSFTLNLKNWPLSAPTTTTTAVAATTTATTAKTTTIVATTFYCWLSRVYFKKSVRRVRVFHHLWEKNFIVILFFVGKRAAGGIVEEGEEVGATAMQTLKEVNLTNPMA